MNFFLSRSAACDFSSHCPASAKPRSGFSLIEVVIAMVLLSTGLIASVMALQFGLKQLEYARSSTLAGQALQNEAERLRLLSWDQISDLSAEAEADLTSTFGTDAIPGRQLRVVRKVEDLAGVAGMKIILLEASWKGVDGQTHRARTQIHYARGGINDYYYAPGTPVQPQ